MIRLNSEENCNVFEKMLFQNVIMRCIIELIDENEN